MTKEMAERVKMVKAMEYIARHINAEDVMESWLTVGVADGDIEYGDLYDNPDGVEWYVESGNLRELMETFLRVMSRAKEDGGLYCDGICSED